MLVISACCHHLQSKTKFIVSSITFSLSDNTLLSIFGEIKVQLMQNLWAIKPYLSQTDLDAKI